MDQEAEAKKEVAVVNPSNDKSPSQTSTTGNATENVNPVLPAAVPRKRKPKTSKEESERLLALEEERWKGVLKSKFKQHIDQYENRRHPCDVLYEYEGDMLDEYVLMYDGTQTGHLDILARVINEHREKYGRKTRVKNHHLGKKMTAFRNFLKEKEKKPDLERSCRPRVQGDSISNKESMQKMLIILERFKDQFDEELKQRDLDAKKPKSAKSRSTRKTSKPSTSACVHANDGKEQEVVPTTVLEGSNSSCQTGDGAIMEESDEKTVIGIVVEDFSMGIESDDQVLHVESGETVNEPIEIDKEDAEHIPTNNNGLNAGFDSFASVSSIRDSKGDMSRRHEFGPPIENDPVTPLGRLFLLDQNDTVLPDCVQMTREALFRYSYEIVGEFNTNRSEDDSVVLMHPQFAADYLKTIKGPVKAKPKQKPKKIVVVEGGKVVEEEKEPLELEPELKLTPEELVKYYGCFIGETGQIQRAIVPVFRGQHFIVVHYGRNANNKVHAHIMDSKLTGPTSPYLSDKEARLIGAQLFNVPLRKVVPSRANGHQIPYQDNGYDCGPHTILSTEACLRDDRFNPDITHLSVTRNPSGESMIAVRERVSKVLKAMYVVESKLVSRRNTVPRTDQQHNVGISDGKIHESVEKIDDSIGIDLKDFSIDMEDEGQVPHAKSDEIVDKSRKINKEKAELVSNNETGNDLVIQSIFHNEKPLRLSGNLPHLPNVLLLVLEKIRNTIEQSVSDSSDGWVVPPQPDNATVMEYMEMYNTIVKQFATNWSSSYKTDILGQWGELNCTATVAIDITTFAYWCAVPRPHVLNHHYKSFSSETFGETDLDTMKIMIDRMKLGPRDVFVDLGDGVGQLVCFTAAYAKCKSVGIELSDVPAKMGTELAEYFKKLMDFFGKDCGEYEHFHGNFLDPKFRKLICDEASVIFINNFAFDPDVMLQIKETLLMKLKNDVRIITTKPFEDFEKPITIRTENALTAISHTELLEFGSVSWKSEKVEFYCTTIDHTKLQNFKLEQERKSKLSKSERIREEFEKYSKKSKTSSRQDVSEVDTPRADYVADSQSKKRRHYKSAREAVDIPLKKSKTSNRMSAEEVGTPRVKEVADDADDNVIVDNTPTI